MFRRVVSFIVFLCIFTVMLVPLCSVSAATLELKNGYAYVMEIGTAYDIAGQYYQVKLGYNDGSEEFYRIERRLTVNGTVIDTNNTNLKLLGEFIYYRLSAANNIYYIEYDTEEPMSYGPLRYNASTRCFTAGGITIKRDGKPLYQFYNDYTVGQAFPDGNHDYYIQTDKYHTAIIHADSGMDATILGTNIIVETPYNPGMFCIWVKGEYVCENKSPDMMFRLEVKDTAGNLVYNDYSDGVSYDNFWFGAEVPKDGTSYNIRMWIEAGGQRISPIYERRCTLPKYEFVRGVITAVAVDENDFELKAEFKIRKDDGTEKIYSVKAGSYIGGYYCESGEDFKDALAIGKWATFAVGNNGKIDFVDIYNKKPCLLKFWRNDGSGLLWYSEYVEYGEYYYWAEWETKDGWTFMGWYGNPQGYGNPFINAYGEPNGAVLGDMNLYPVYRFGDSFDWGEDTLSFSTYGYFWGNKYYISDEHFNKLTEDLSSREKSAMKKKRNEKFDGSAYGMSAVMAVFSGYKNASRIQKGRENLAELSYPKDNNNVASVINTYNLSQFLPYVQDEIDRQSARGTKYIADDIILDNMQNYNRSYPYLLIYEYKEGKKWYQNTVVVIGMEEYEFGYKLHIADPYMIVRSDPFASEYIPVKENAPTYMYIDGPPTSEVAYRGAEGEHSLSAGTLRLKAALIEGWEYKDIEILSSSEDDKTTLSVNFDVFDIESETTSASLTEEGKTGELEISEGTVIGGREFTEYSLPAEETFTVEAKQDIEGEYAADMVFECDESLNIYSKSAEKAQFVFGKYGTASVTTENATDKSIAISLDSESWYIGEVGISAQVKELNFEYLGNSEFKVSSSESLKGAILSVTDSCERYAEIEISDEVQEFYFVCEEDEDGMPCIVLEGTNDNQMVVGSCSVVFCTGGGSEVETLTDIASGSLIDEPEAPEREGYIFEGWLIDEWDDVIWDFENDVVEGSMLLYAKWEPDPEYNKIFTLQANGERMQEIFSGEHTVSLGQYSEMFESKGTEVIGWTSVENSNEVEFARDAEITISEETTLYAITEKEFIIETKADELNNECYVNVALYNPEGTEKVFVAGYKGDRMVGCQSFDVDGSSADARLEIMPDTIKVMLWYKNGVEPVIKTIDVSRSNSETNE